jgi:dihydroflavonol-4-reductase
VIVNPAHVFGRGDVNRSSTEIVRRFLRRELPAYVDGAINIVDAEDVARGHLLADELGVPGERYILGNRNFTWDRLFADLGRLSGVEPPALKLPLHVALGLAATIERMPGKPVLTSDEVRIASYWWTLRSNKARRELGWQPSHHEDTLQATIDWYREREPHRVSPSGARQPLALRVVGGAVREVSRAADRIPIG